MVKKYFEKIKQAVFNVCRVCRDCVKDFCKRCIDFIKGVIG